jgi:hypothetical protein
MISFQGTHVVTDVILTCVRLWSAKILSLYHPPASSSVRPPDTPPGAGSNTVLDTGFPSRDNRQG